MKRPSHIEHTFKTKEDFSNYLRKRHKSMDFAGSTVLDLKNLSFQYHLMLPVRIKSTNHSDTNLGNFLGDCKYAFSGCEFENAVTIRRSKRQIEFNNCCFNEVCKIGGFEKDLSFYNSTFLKESELICQNATFKGRVRFRNCEFEGITNFKNATFEDYIDFWKSIFYKKTDFYKTDFFGDVYMPAVVFKENVLFTYSLIDKTIILRGATFEKGLDFSLAVLKGDANTFQIKLSNFQGVDYENEDDYNSSISDKLDIPNTNKRETFRLLKQINEKGNNLIEALYFKVLEKESLLEEVTKKKLSWEKVGDLIMLFLNKWSNNFGTSIPRAFLFTIGIGFITFLLSVVFTPNYEFTINPMEWDFDFGLKYFPQFLLPTHKFNYMDNAIDTNSWFYVFDFLGRTLVGYGIYQFIQAFRKFR